MKKSLRLLGFSFLFGGLVQANQITLSCVSIGPAELTYQIAMDCYVHSPVVNLTTLALKKDAAPTASDSRNDVVDTRTDLAQTVAPAAIISGIPVYMPAVAVVSNSSPTKQNQNAASTGDGTHTSSGTGVATSTAHATSGGGGGGESSPQPVVNNSNSSMAAQAGGFTQSSPVAAMLGVPPSVAVDSPTVPMRLGVIDPPSSGAAAVPEPSVWLLTALGCAGLLYRARRRRTA